MFDFNMKAQLALFLKALTTWLTRYPFNAIMDIFNMLPEIILFSDKKIKIKHGNAFNLFLLWV